MNGLEFPVSIAWQFARSERNGGFVRWVAFLCLFSTPLLGLTQSPLQFRVTSPGPGAGTAVTVCAIDPTDPSIAYVGGDCQGIMRTLDGGRTWAAPNTGLIDPKDSFYEAYFALEIEVDPSAPQHVYAGTQRGLYQSADQAQTWDAVDFGSAVVHLDGGNHIPVGAVEVDPDNSDWIYVGIGDIYLHDQAAVKGTLLRSQDRGESWQRIGAGVIPEEAIIYDIELDPKPAIVSERQLLVSTDRGIFHSLDGGNTLKLFIDGLPHRKARRLTVSRTRGGGAVFYVSMFPDGERLGGVFRWNSEAPSWKSANGEGGDLPLIVEDEVPCLFNWIVAHPNDPDIVYLASAPSYVEAEQCDTETYFITTDGGQTWEEQWPAPESAWVEEPSILAMLAISQSAPEVLVAGYVSMIRSNDGGDSWEQVYADTKTESNRIWSRARAKDIGSQMWALSMTADPRAEHADTLYMGHADALLFKTEDLEWFRRLAPGAVVDPIADLAAGWGEGGDGNLTPQVTLDPANPDIVYASANFRLFRSLDRGDTWEELTGWGNPYTDTSHEVLNRDNATRFAIDPSSPPDRRRILATVFPGGLYRSDDNGVTWVDLSDKLGESAGNVSGVYLDPSNPERIFLGTFSQVHYSQQNMWERYPIFHSNDGGETWSARADLPLVNRLWIDPSEGNRLLAACLDMNEEDNGGGVYLSRDGGLSWERTLEQPIVTDIAADPHVKDRLWALSSSYYQPDYGVDLPNVLAGLYLSEDRGVTWRRTALELNHYMLYPLLIHPSRPDELFIGTAGAGVKRVQILSPTEPKPRLQVRWRDNQLELEISELVPNQSYRLESSSDLVRWALVEELVAANLPIRLPISSESEQVFYRLSL